MIKTKTNTQIRNAAVKHMQRGLHEIYILYNHSMQKHKFTEFNEKKVYVGFQDYW